MAASKAAEQLFGFFRKGEANDPETYVAGIAAVLASYPEDVMRQVVRPGGYLACAKFMPQQGEVREACEAAMAPRREAEQRAAAFERRQAQLAEREEWLERQQQMDVARIQRVADDLTAEAARLTAKMREEDAARRQRSLGLIEAENAKHNSVDLGGGWKCSAEMKGILEKMRADTPDAGAYEGKPGT